MSTAMTNSDCMLPSELEIETWKPLLDLSAPELYRSPYQFLGFANTSESYESPYEAIASKPEPRQIESTDINARNRYQEDPAALDKLSMTEDQYRAIPCSYRSPIASDHSTAGDSPGAFKAPLELRFDQSSQDALSPELSTLQPLSFDSSERNLTESVRPPSREPKTLDPNCKEVDIPIQPSQISLVQINGSLLLEVKWASSLLPLHSCWGQWKPRFTSESAIPTPGKEPEMTAKQGEKRKRGRPVQKGKHH